MRIAIVAPPWVPVPPPGYGGTEAVLDGLARGLDRLGHQVLLYTTGDSTCPVSKAWVIAKGLGTAQLSPAVELHHVINAYDEIRDWQPDIVHDHTLTGPFYGANLGIPVVTTNHGTFEGELSDIYRVVSERVPVVAISHHQAASARGRVARVIHHGIDVDAFARGPGAGDYALFLGRMVPDKGVDVAVRVARAAGIPLKIAAKVADVAEKEYFGDEVEPMLGDGIEFVGEVGGEHKLELLARARCLLNPIQWNEPFGMVMVEALAAGTPIVATPMGSVPEIVEDGVTGFVRRTEHELADAVGHVSELDRRACRASARRRFSLDRMVHEHVRLYQEVIAP